jgi:hypothetical protein
VDIKTPKAITEAIPPDYRSLPKDERRKIARRLARQIISGTAPTISSQLALPGS